MARKDKTRPYKKDRAGHDTSHKNRPDKARRQGKTRQDKTGQARHAGQGRQGR